MTKNYTMDEVKALASKVVNIAVENLEVEEAVTYWVEEIKDILDSLKLDSGILKNKANDEHLIAHLIFVSDDENVTIITEDYPSYKPLVVFRAVEMEEGHNIAKEFKSFDEL